MLLLDSFDLGVFTSRIIVILLLTSFIGYALLVSRETENLGDNKFRKL